MPDHDRDTGELKHAQAVRAEEEAELADRAEGAEAEAHLHRAHKADYLRDQLEQRDRAEREAGD